MNDYTQRRLEEQIEEWKKEVGEIPENTCPSIDGIINDIEKYVDEVEYLRKNAHKYESAEDLGKDLPDSGWSGLASDIDVKLRKDNEKLRELGIFWYEKCKELSTSIAQALAEERERVRGEIEKLATCSDCNGTGIKDCEQCERNSHKCSRCFETGEVSIQKDDLLSSLDKEIINPKE